MKFTSAALTTLLWMGAAGSTSAASAATKASTPSATAIASDQYHRQLRTLQTELPPMGEEEDDTSTPPFEADTTGDTSSSRGKSPSSDDEKHKHKSYKDLDVARTCKGGITSDNMYKTKCKAESESGNTYVEDSTEYKVMTSGRGITIEMKYESETGMTSASSDDNEKSPSIDDNEKSSSSDENNEEDNLDLTSAEDDGGDERKKLLRKRRKVQETEVENKFEATFHTACLYRKAGTSSSSSQPSQEAEISTAQGRQIDIGTSIELANNLTGTDGDVNSTISDANPQQPVASTDPAMEAFEWGVDVCDTEINLMDWSTIEDLFSDDVDTTKFSSVANGMAEFLFTVVQRSTTDLSSNSIKFDLNVDGVAAQMAGTDYHLAIFADVKTKQKIEVEKSGSDDEDEEPTSDEGSSTFVAETGTKSSTSAEIRDITVPFTSSIVGGGSQFTPLGHFSWKDEAEATSTTVEPGTGRRLQVTDTIKVIATVPADQVDQRQRTIAFSFTGQGSMGADYIHWDPEAGVGYRSSSASLATGFAVVVMAAATVCTLLF